MQTLAVFARPQERSDASEKTVPTEASDIRRRHRGRIRISHAAKTRLGQDGRTRVSHARHTPLKRAGQVKKRNA
jgi:hypothetical protein